MYETEIAAEIRELGPAEQKEVLDFAAFLRSRAPAQPRRSIKGVLSHLNVHLTQEDFDEVRRDVSKGFPRDLLS